MDAERSARLGGKHVCTDCRTRFYDLNQTPARCPRCGRVFDTTSPAPSSSTSRYSRNLEADYETDDEEALPELDLDDAESVADVEEDMTEDESTGFDIGEDVMGHDMDGDDDSDVTDLINGSLDPDEDDV